MKKFKKIYIEITNVCNLSCDFCPVTKRKPQFMELDTFTKVLNQIKGHGEHIYFHVKGEPLLHPELERFLDLSSENVFKVNITTNGTLIGKVKHKLLGKSALRQMNISLHSYDANDSIQSMDEYLNNIISFAKEAVNKSDIIIALRLWNLDKDNETNLQRQRNRHILQVLEEAFGLSFKIDEKISKERGVKLIDRVFLNQDYEFKWPDIEDKDREHKGFCYGLRNQIAILVDGTVVPCCLDGEGVVNLGNINKKTFSEIIEDERASSIINGFSRREAVEELCKNCTYRRRFD